MEPAPQGAFPFHQIDEGGHDFSGVAFLRETLRSLVVVLATWSICSRQIRETYEVASAGMLALSDLRSKSYFIVIYWKVT